MKRILLFFMAVLPVWAAGQNVTDVSARQVGNTVEVTYSLDKATTVSLLLSQDGGQTYAATPKAVTGDVGQVQTGNNKKIVWNLLKDAPDWDIAQARFKVVAEKIKSLRTFIVSGVLFTMIRVEGGTFTMGCTPEQGDECNDNETPAHQVTLSDYYIGQTEVTQGLWKAVMKGNPSKFSYGDNYPVEQVSWDDCQTFISKLNSLLESELGGAKFALPTEAQWEYAARGGNKSQYYKYSGSNSITNFVWNKDNSTTTHPVGTKFSNELELYDMSGNVWEWCHDRYGSYKKGAQTDPTGATSGSARVYRGGSWMDGAKNCRVSARGRNTASEGYFFNGLRLVLLQF